MYFEHGEKRILFDTGASDKFIYNATLLGIDLHKVDTCIISHPHNDHTGGLKSFLEINRNARVVIKRAAQGDFYTKRGHKMIRTGLEPGFLISTQRGCIFLMTFLRSNKAYLRPVFISTGGSLSIPR